MGQQSELIIDPVRTVQALANRYGAQVRVIDCKNLTDGMTLLLEVVAPRVKMGDVLDDLKKSRLFKSLCIAHAGASRSFCIAVLDRARGEWNPNQNDDLTPHQREILCTAISLGFYEFPRRINLTTLSREVGIRPSTLSELLRGAERKIMHEAYWKFGLADSDRIVQPIPQ